MMNTIIAVAVAVVVIAAVIVSLVLWRKHGKSNLNTDYFQTKWQELQKLLKAKEEWRTAVLAADHLLDEALKKKHISGRNMGARLVKAQRMFSDNDSLWFGHKLRTKLDADPDLKLKKKDVQDALVGIRQALKDLGALPK